MSWWAWLIAGWLAGGVLFTLALLWLSHNIDRMPAWLVGDEPR